MRYTGIISGIECRADGELPHERKDHLTVHGSHPAVIIMFSTRLLIISAADNKEVFLCRKKIRTVLSAGHH